MSDLSGFLSPGMTVPFGAVDVDFTSIVTDGFPTNTLPAPEDSGGGPLVVSATTSLAGGLGQQLLDVSPTIRSLNGLTVVPVDFGYLDLGGGHQLSFDPSTAQGRITPTIANDVLQRFEEYQGEPWVSFSGSDLKILVEVATPPLSGDSPARFHKQLLEATTMSVSVHRVKSPAMACGYINPKGFGRGRRTIAGTIVLTQFTTDVLMRFLQDSLTREDASKDSYYSKADQVPSLNFTLFFSNEQGFASYRRLLGVELVDDGTTYSSQDMFSEQVFTYMAADFTPLLPLNRSNLAFPRDRRRKQENTVQHTLEKRAQIDSPLPRVPDLGDLILHG